MCEATLGTSSSASSSSSPRPPPPPPPFHTNPSKPARFGFKSKSKSKVGAAAESELNPTSPGALISQPPTSPTHKDNTDEDPYPHPDDVKKSLTTFEDPLGLGLETLPTTDHADKMVKRGERKIKLGSLLHSGKLVSHRVTFISKWYEWCSAALFAWLMFSLFNSSPFFRSLARGPDIATTRTDLARQSRTGPFARDRPTSPGKGNDRAEEG
jgi:hypothetical protein